MMKKILFTAIFATVFCSLTVSAQERFKVGDLVEATYAGNWVNAVIVGEYEKTDYGYGTYQIHYEGDRDHASHATDMRIDEKFVRLRQGNSANVRNNTSDNQYNPNAGVRNSTNAASGKIKNGEGVMYRGGGPIWGSDAKIVSYDAEKRQYKIMDKSGSGDYLPCHSVHKIGEKINNGFFIGNWEVSVTGANSTVARSGKVYDRVSGGMNLPPLEVKADGTYIWRLSPSQAIRGRWEDRDGVPGITLLKAIDVEDYTLFEKTEGYVPTAETRDEIGITHLPSGTGYYMAYRIGANKSCVLTGRNF